MAHITIFGYIIIVMVGLWTIFLTHHTHQRLRLPVLKFLEYYIIAFNLWIFVYVVAKYSVVNLWERGFQSANAVLLIPALFFVAFGLAHSLVNVTARLRGRENAGALNRALAFAAVVFATAYAVGFIEFWRKATLKGLTVTSVVLVFTVLLVAVVVLIDLVLRTPRSFDPDRRRVLRGFGLLMLLGYVPYTVAGLLPGSYDLTVCLVAQLWLNLAPIVWIQRFFVPYHERLSLADSDGVLDILARDYKISKREREVMGLIVEGKSNKQIQEQLFISPHTVKNHIYNLYQKLEINSRSQLLSLVMKTNDAGSGGRLNA
jgi:DNA-binding CsgD family transcriptional regulator